MEYRARFPSIKSKRKGWEKRRHRYLRTRWPQSSRAGQPQNAGNTSKTCWKRWWLQARHAKAKVAICYPARPHPDFPRSILRFTSWRVPGRSGHVAGSPLFWPSLDPRARGRETVLASGRSLPTGVRPHRHSDRTSPFPERQTIRPGRPIQRYAPNFDGFARNNRVHPATVMALKCPVFRALSILWGTPTNSISGARRGLEPLSECRKTARILTLVT